jgi:hypothetical protein
MRYQVAIPLSRVDARSLLITIFSDKKKTFAIEREVVQGLIRLLLPFKELLTKLQTSKTPSIHLVLIGIGSLRTTLSSFLFV